MAAEQFWDTANHRALSESAALTLMAPYAHQLLSQARQAHTTLPVARFTEQVQRLSNIEVRAGAATWISALLDRVDQRAPEIDPPLSAAVNTTPASVAPARAPRRPVGKAAAPARRPAASAEPLVGAICPSCFTQMSLTGVCDQCA